MCRSRSSLIEGAKKRGEISRPNPIGKHIQVLQQNLGQSSRARGWIARQLMTGEFNRSVQHQSQSIGWGFEAQGLSRALVEPQSNRVQITLRDARQVGSSREVLT